MKSKIFVFLCMICFLWSGMTGLSAQASESLSMGSIMLDGQALAFDQPAIVVDDRLYIPIRPVLSALGMQVEWEQSTVTATATTDGLVVVAQLANPVVTVNGLAIGFRAEPLMRGDRLLLHEQALAEAIGAEITWDSGGGTVTIVTKTAPEAGLPSTEFPITINEGTDYPLPGILSIPEGAAGKVPAVVLVHGSGPQDRDETIFANKPFRDIAAYLTANGIASIRYDKRSFAHGTKMMQELGNSITVREEAILDAIAAADLLRADPRIDADKVFILGHSLGGMLAPRIHAEGGDFAGIISLAGSPRSLLDIMYDQQVLYIDAMPDSEEKSLYLSQLDTYDEQVAALMALSDEEAKNTPASGGVAFYYFKEMDEHPASIYIGDIAVPFLILQGSADFQVYADKDYVAWQTLLAGRTNVTCKLYDGLNHLFMPSSWRSIMDFQEEYSIESRVDESALSDIAEWIKAN